MATKINYYYAKYGRSGGSIEVHRWYKVFEFGRAVYAEKRHTLTTGNWNYKIGTINFVSNPSKLKKITKAIWKKQFHECFDSMLLSEDRLTKHFLQTAKANL